MRYTLTPAAAPDLPVTTDEAKAWLDVDHAADDDMIDALLLGITERVEEATGLALSNRAFTYVAQTAERRFVTGVLLPRGPVTAVASVTVYDYEGASEELVADDDYYVLGSKVRFESGVLLLAGARIEVEFTAGYAAPTDVPAPIKLAIRRAAKDHYDVPGDAVVGLMVSKLPQGALDMLLPYRRMRV